MHNWPTFYPASLSEHVIAKEMMPIKIQSLDEIHGKKSIIVYGFQEY